MTTEDKNLQDIGFIKVRENVTRWSGGAYYENRTGRLGLSIWHVYGNWQYQLHNEHGKVFKCDYLTSKYAIEKIEAMKKSVKPITEQEIEFIYREVRSGNM